MPPPTPLEVAIATALYHALEAEFGVIVRTNDPWRLKPIIYRHRKEIGDEDLMKIQLRISPVNPETDLWLIRRAEPQPED